MAAFGMGWVSWWGEMWSELPAPASLPSTVCQALVAPFHDRGIRELSRNGLLSSNGGGGVLDKCVVGVYVGERGISLGG